jgi:O-antigen ligase
MFVVSLKELIVVMGLSVVMFSLAKPIALRFSDARDFDRRRNIWLVLTPIAFFSPNIWLYVLVAAPLFIWAGRKDKNPVALYLLMLHLVPPVEVPIPFPGINVLFNLSNYRLLSLCVLLPAAWRLRKTQDPERISGRTSIDILIVAYGVIQVVLFVPPNLGTYVVIQDTFTNQLREAFLYFIDIYAAYYVVSRFCSNRAAIGEAMAAFWLACVLMAAVAVFENLRHWLLYTDMAVRWTGDPGFGFAKYRGGVLRAAVSSGNPLALSYMFAIACGFWVYLGSFLQSKVRRYGVMFLLWLGLVVTYSRGPWIGAAVIYIVIAVLGRRALSRLVKGGVGALLLLLVAAQFPVGGRIIRLLPFMKQAGDEETNFSITYRQRLATRSWELIQEHPLLGDQLALQKLNDLRQGEGIIDTVNTYAEVTMFYGFIGITIFIVALLIPMLGAYRVARRTLQSDPEFALLGSALVACIVGTLVMLISCSFILAYQELFYVLAGLAAAYAHIGRRAAAARSPERR